MAEGDQTQQLQSSNGGTDAGADKGTGGANTGVPRGGASGGNIYDALSADNKAWFEKKGWNRGGENGGPVSLDTVFGSVRSAESLIGKNNLQQPDPTAADFDKWPGFKALGVPDKPDGYNFTRPQMPNGADGKPIAYDEEAEKVLRQALFDGKVPASKAQAAYDQLTALQIARAQAFQQEVDKDRSETDAALTRDWGAQKAANIDRSRNAWNQLAQKIGIDPGVLKADTNAFLGSVGVIKLGLYLAGQLGEDVIVPADGRVGDTSTPAGARATLTAKEADPEFRKALYDAGHPGHAAAVKLRRDLSARATGA